jgi:hypothetical protein
MKVFPALLVVVLAGCSVAGAAAAGEHAALPSASPLKSCGKVTGAKWVFPKTGGKFTGNTYGVTAVRVDCEVAKKYAIKLSGTTLAGKTAGHSYPLAGGPKGYICHANPDANGKVLAGSCQDAPLNTVAKHVFSWGGRP